MNYGNTKISSDEIKLISLSLNIIIPMKCYCLLDIHLILSWLLFMYIIVYMYLNFE